MKVEVNIGHDLYGIGKALQAIPNTINAISNAPKIMLKLEKSLLILSEKSQKLLINLVKPLKNMWTEITKEE